MKYLNYFIILLLLLSFSCNQNGLKTNEKALVQMVLTEEEKLEKESKQRAEQEKQMADSLAKLPKGIRFMEDRSIDPKYPPVVIDIVGSRKQTPQKLKLSRFFSKIEYVRLDAVPDSNFYNSYTQYFVNTDYIYSLTNNGIAQYNRDGSFVKYICKNECVTKEIKGVGIMSFIDWEIFVGATQANLLGNELFYRWEKHKDGITELMKYDEKSEATGLPIQNREHNNNPNFRTGEKMANLFINARKVSGRVRTMPLNKYYFTHIPSMKLVMGEKIFLALINMRGDTVCAFRDFDPVINYTKTLVRGVDDGNAYYSNGNLLIRQSFNDTIYQLLPPNRLIPRYILSFGKLGIHSAREGVDPGISLKEKLVPHSFLETTRYIFITYTKDYECPNNAKTGTLKYSRLIFDKKNKTSILVYRDEKPFIHEKMMYASSAPELNIENDLDKTPFRWPQLTTTDGIPFIVLSGKEIKEDPAFPIKNIHDNDKILVIYH